MEGYKVFKKDIKTLGAVNRIYITNIGSANDSTYALTVAWEISQRFQGEIYRREDDMGFFSKPSMSEKHKAFIEQMDLVIFVVSKEFLDTTNFAKDEELPFVKSILKPVMFITIENGLEEAFNKKCGTYHLLNMNLNDGNYLNRLMNSLENRFKQYHLLVEEEGKIERLEDCYTSNAFISYRRKNRQEANLLVKQIRSLPYFRDMRLWYDDFLKEGEDYNLEIEAELQNADIIFLLITPEILEHGNYVMDIEYPMAKKYEKIIIPVIAEPVDTNLLSERYIGIGACVELRDRNALSARIIDAYTQLKIEIKPLSPMRKYLLGCAYFDGKNILTNNSYNIETNVELGIMLLQEAAEQGSAQALNKLGNIYMEGMFLEKNIACAILCFEKAVQKLKIMFYQAVEQKNMDYSTRNSYRVLLVQLVDLYIQSGRLEDAQNMLGERMRVNQLNDEVGLYESIKTNIGTIYWQQGRIYYYKKQYQEALQCYEAAQVPMLEMESRFDMEAAVLNCMKLFIDMGNLHSKIAELKEWDMYRSNALELTRQCYTYALKRAKRLSQNFNPDYAELVIMIQNTLNQLPIF